jgi:hypothetical protein
VPFVVVFVGMKAKAAEAFAGTRGARNRIDGYALVIQWILGSIGLSKMCRIEVAKPSPLLKKEGGKFVLLVCAQVTVCSSKRA